MEKTSRIMHESQTWQSHMAKQKLNKLTLMNNMKLMRLVLLGILVSTGILNAQTDFRPGYIIKTTGDTIFGQIDYRSDLLMSSLCKFKDVDNTITYYSPIDIGAFRFLDSKFYVSRKVDGAYFFLEFLIKGKVNIYYMRDENGDHYYVEKENVGLTKIPYEEGIRNIDNKAYYYESTKHTGLLYYYMQDAPELQARIQSIRKPAHRNLIKLAEEYHNAVCKDEKCIVYHKSSPLIKVLPEIISGVINYTNAEGIIQKLYFQTAIIGHIWMPRLSEKAYFRTGVIFSQLYLDGEKSNVYKIPCQIEYIYPRGTFRPRIAYGLNFFYPIYQSVSFNLGGNIKLSEKLFLSVTSDIEFHPIMLIVPESRLSHSFQIGLFVNLE